MTLLFGAFDHATYVTILNALGSLATYFLVAGMMGLAFSLDALIGEIFCVRLNADFKNSFRRIWQADWFR